MDRTYARGLYFAIAVCGGITAAALSNELPRQWGVWASILQLGLVALKSGRSKSAATSTPEGEGTK